MYRLKLQFPRLQSLIEDLSTVIVLLWPLFVRLIALAEFCLCQAKFLLELYMAPVARREGFVLVVTCGLSSGDDDYIYFLRRHDPTSS